MGVAILIWMVGFLLIIMARSDVSRFIGLFLAIEGTVFWAVIKIVTHVRLCMYWILRDADRRLKRELRASEAADL